MPFLTCKKYYENGKPQKAWYFDNGGWTAKVRKVRFATLEHMGYNSTIAITTANGSMLFLFRKNRQEKWEDITSDSVVEMVKKKESIDAAAFEPGTRLYFSFPRIDIVGFVVGNS